MLFTKKFLKKVYNLLEDDTSKKIWSNRLLYSLTDDSRYLLDVIFTTDIGKSIYTRMKCSNEKKIIFGAGIIGKKLIDVFYDIQFECFVDNNHANEICKGIPVIDIETLKKEHLDDLIIISSRVFHSEILEQLLAEGFKEENIINIGEACDKLSRLQYFDLPELKSDIKEKEIFVDGGCYDGKSSCEFKKWCNNSGVKETFTYAWEPDPINIKACKTTLNINQCQYKIINKGLWSGTDTLYFETAGISSAICENGTLQINVDSIDNIITTPVTFIKMDIEGSEYEALLGAERVIKNFKPKLAISIYHKAEDIWKLPLLIHQFNPDYKFYLRHYSFADNDTVLYAIDTNN